MLKKSTLLFVSIFFLLFIGLSDYGYGCHKGEDHGKFTNCPPPDPGPTGGTDQYSASVEFDDDDTDCDNTKIRVDRDRFCSDGDGIYFDGVDNVGAGGDKFRFGLNLQAGGVRTFFLDFSDGCLDPSGTDPVCGFVPLLDTGDGTGPMGLTTSSDGNGDVFSTGEPGFSLLDMAVPDESGSFDMRDRLVLISFRDTNNHAWGLSFGVLNPDECDSDLVSVTRINADTWEFVSDDGIACLERAKNGTKGPPILQGRYTVPFKFTVTLFP